VVKEKGYRVNHILQNFRYATFKSPSFEQTGKIENIPGKMEEIKEEREKGSREG
jgi:hypothetical protein